MAVSKAAWSMVGGLGRWSDVRKLNISGVERLLRREEGKRIAGVMANLAGRLTH